MYDSKAYSIAEITEMTGVSKPTLYRKLRERDSNPKLYEEASSKENNNKKGEQ
ncbi:helix-turn-helix domain-containing protein [Bacillus mojavensis]|uniref:helix-turn-helix domain-containing protein n=1 Tax=Bacillus mojavensis TaxID=72360 RepID=UPI0039A6A0E1